MGEATLFVLLHGGMAVACAGVWAWGQWRLHSGYYAGLVSFLWPRRLLWLGIVLTLLAVTTVGGRRTWLDLTPDRAFSLTPASLAVLGSLSRPVEVLVALPGRRGAEAMTVLERYRRASELIQIRALGEDRDAESEPALPGEGVLLRVDEWVEFLSAVSEETVTNALVRLSEKRTRVVYILAGHGEPAIDDPGPAGFAGLKHVLSKERCDVRRLLLVNMTAVPADADLLIIPSGVKAPLPEEEAVITRHVRAGGEALFFLASDQAAVWADLLAELGVVWDRQWVKQRVAARPVKDHPLAQAIPRNSVAVLSGFFPIRVWGRLPEGAEVRPALVSEESEKLSPALAAARAPGQGFLVFGVTGEYPASGTQARTRLAVFGGQGFATNAGLSLLANQEVVVGCVRWLTRGEDQVRIPPRTRTPAQMIIAPESLENTFVLLVLLPPEVFLLAGVVGLGVKGRL
jgi:hypothetical protein